MNNNKETRKRNACKNQETSKQNAPHIIYAKLPINL